MSGVYKLSGNNYLSLKEIQNDLYFIFFRVLNPDCVLLKLLGKRLSFEVAIGMNGRLWIKARSISETIAIANAISASEYMSNEQMKEMCKRLLDALAGF